MRHKIQLRKDLYDRKAGRHERRSIRAGDGFSYVILAGRRHQVFGIRRPFVRLDCPLA